MSVQDLKRDYTGRHGFIFQGAGPCDPRKCELVAAAVKANSYTDSMPEFVVSLNEQTFAFVYSETCNFESGPFYKDTRQVCAMLGAFNIDILTAFLNER